ncbi:MAG: PQQ-binding-like beta-propeller repeat protein [Dehalococcoidia bacterium]|nr:PQQ-binding-like beta-propeller repeat protein [Dehalococcoidia bacterium]
MKALFVTFVLVLVTISCAQEPSAAAGWSFVGSDQAHTKYSAAEEITASNVGELEIAWKWEPKETPLEEYDTQQGPFQATPIMVNGILYLSTMYTRVAALDAETGAERWTFERQWVFFTIPQSSDDFGADTWQDESWRITGHANLWGLMSLDTERGLLYVPTSTPSSDYWGGRRKGADLFAESLVCLDAHTGERKWHFQTVHHGLWDYDLSAAPNLVTITVDGREIDAVAQVAKNGFTYVFDRVTGEPGGPIEERAVDTVTDVPGEELYPTQPFPTKPPPFARQGVTLEDANDLTPEIHALAVAEMKRFRLGPLFTPPSLQGTLQRPGASGGANWGGAAFDPETGFLYVRTTEDADTNQVCESSGDDPRVDVEYSNNCPYGATLVMYREAGGPGAAQAPESKQ